VVIPESGCDEASQAAERLRSAVEAKPFAWSSGSHSRMTAGIGLACSAPRLPTPEALVQSAASALCEAQRRGHNRVALVAPTASAG
jgi:diguanylate cyclase (GGDEF)-like protein